MKNVCVMGLTAFAALGFIAMPMAAAKGPKTEGMITIKGSDTMVHLVSSWAEEFMTANADTAVSVTGGGSGTGIAALLNGTTDICAASREMKEEERTQAKDKGINPTETVVGRDGIAVVVNPANPVKELTLDQLKQIYTAKVTNWNQVGGSDHAIVVLSRESSSGTYVFFQEHVLKKEDYAAGVRLMPATSAIIEATASDQWSIGYVGLGYAENAKDRVKPIGVKADAAALAVLPSEKTVLDATYSIARPLYFYTDGAPAGSLKSFVDFCLSPKGQDIVREQGYVPLPVKK